MFRYIPTSWIVAVLLIWCFTLGNSFDDCFILPRSHNPVFDMLDGLLGCLSLGMVVAYLAVLYPRFRAWLNN